jgi:hypothetical protein
MALLVKKKIRQPLVEVGLLALLLALAAAAVFVSLLFDWSWPQIPAFAILAGTSLYLIARSISSLWHRCFGAFFLRFLAGLLLLPIGLVGFAVVGMAGKFVAMVEFEKGTLPLRHSTLRQLRGEAERMARDISSAAENELEFTPESVSLEFGGPHRSMEFEFVSTPEIGGHFRGSVDFRQHNDGAWKLAGRSSSGDPKTFDVLRAAFEKTVQQLPAPTLDWAVPGEIESRFSDAAAKLAAELTARGVFELADKPWHLGSVRFSHRLSGSGGDSVIMVFRAKESDERGAYFFSYWTFDGKVARLRDVSAGIDRGSASSSTRENNEEVRTELNEILSSMPDSVLRPEKESSRGWDSCTATLPDGSKLTYSQQSAHPFLAEYNMRATIELPDGRRRVFSLPMNTGGRTAVFVSFGKKASGSPAIRMTAGRHFDTAFDLTKPAFTSPDEVLDPEPLGAFLQISTPLQWVAVGDGDATHLLDEARQYTGLHGTPLDGNLPINAPDQNR